jgi:hypothetical protein
VPLQPLPAFFERFLNGFGERLAGFAGHLAASLSVASFLMLKGMVIDSYTVRNSYIP